MYHQFHWTDKIVENKQMKFRVNLNCFFIWKGVSNMIVEKINVLKLTLT